MRGPRGLYSPSRATAYAVVAAACIVPRLAVLLHERTSILTANTEKSDVFAQVFVAHGTYGFIPGEPSAYTQPLYGWFLVPVYWLFGRTWQSVGFSQLALAVIVAWLVYEIGRRVLGRGAGVVAAVISTVNPYLIWHDMHVNREIVDQVCSAALVLATLAVADRPTWRRGALLGVVTGLAMLGNTRLVFVPILCAVYLAFRLPHVRATAIVCGVVLAGATVTVMPWLIRNKVNVGCLTMTTDGRAMWKANNAGTYGLLSQGEWIDNVGPNAPRPPEPGHLTPEEARGRYDATNHRVVLHPDECLEMTFYENLAFHYWAAHPVGKLKLAALSTKLLWQPSVFETSGRPGTGTQLDIGRRVIEPVYMWIVYVLAFAGLFVAPRYFVALALLLLLYQTAAAWAFVGATRYRIAWDFLLALLATAALQAAWRRLRTP
jgi:4-amino-4-deoxy-L-arabinose transferase-like glycosyltransferase